ncbi:PLDc N-terminal domain-containing protein [Rathayibacter tanaceti]|uniref:Cardiolipin synthase N-terminal domain-containing protein n=2 Tax=Rathayibacter tanaceti TaxID=1671680 RepID=A0A166IFF3_9MICO|nr:PLDc N-terminal domain-containing protein [Rathayibacter tanaceti]KZX22293.1 hypothetical protein ACH61_00534 [Rathayibacter tanaceti]QHC56119.1 hypothetical protein GSU10_11075 [Rathayibacter tanaceti]TCO36956.1 phospholipase D-like protein [Rathayibacter tanaceti]
MAAPSAEELANVEEILRALVTGLGVNWNEVETVRRAKTEPAGGARASYPRRMGFLFSLLIVMLMVLALVDVVRQPDSVVRNLPKIVWVLLIVFIPIIGVSLWFLLGHEWKRGDGGSFVPGGRAPRRRSQSPSTIIVRPAPMTTEEQLAELEREEAHYARLAEEQRRRREGDRPST